jgi:hypothetical protein
MRTSTGLCCASSMAARCVLAVAATAAERLSPDSASWASPGFGLPRCREHGMRLIVNALVEFLRARELVEQEPLLSRIDQPHHVFDRLRMQILRALALFSASLRVWQDSQQGTIPLCGQNFRTISHSTTFGEHRP